MSTLVPSTGILPDPVIILFFVQYLSHRPDAGNTTNYHDYHCCAPKEYLRLGEENWPAQRKQSSQYSSCQCDNLDTWGTTSSYCCESKEHFRLWEEYWPAQEKNFSQYSSSQCNNHDTGGTTDDHCCASKEHLRLREEYWPSQGKNSSQYSSYQCDNPDTGATISIQQLLLCVKRTLRTRRKVLTYYRRNMLLANLFLPVGLAPDWEKNYQ